MKAFIFPGQGAQFVGMGKDMYDSSDVAKTMFQQANEILGFDIAQIMFAGTDEDLRQTRVTQPAIFLHSAVTARLKMSNTDLPNAVAGHSLGEFSALVAAQALRFEDALALVYKRAMAMQQACDTNKGTMSAIMIQDFSIVETVCAEVTAQTGNAVVAANYNNPGQLVISGSEAGIAEAAKRLSEKGAKVIPLSVGGAFHSPLMQPAQEELQKAIEHTQFTTPICPIYQNVDAQATQDVAVIKDKLIRQLTAPVRWQQSIENMVAAGIEHFVEVGGRGSILLGMVRKIHRAAKMEQLA